MTSYDKNQDQLSIKGWGIVNQTDSSIFFMLNNFVKPKTTLIGVST